MFQLVNVQRLVIATVVEIIAGHWSASHRSSSSRRTLDSWCVDGAWTGNLCAVGEHRNKCFVVCTRMIVDIL
jgi:hypothetical protein